MRVVCISDTHALHGAMDCPVPDGDLLIHAGDLTRKGSLDDVESFNAWLGLLPHKYKVVIAGNHDFCFENNRVEAERCLTNGIYLQDSEITIEGVKIYGSPWQPWFFDWAFNLRRGEDLANIWAKIPSDTDILVTHGPPYGILDRTSRGEPVGCRDLLERVSELSLRLHLFGHIHEAYGQVPQFGSEIGCQFVNASICTLQYEATNAPIIVEV